jgi:hypothetical protein
LDSHNGAGAAPRAPGKDDGVKSSVRDLHATLLHLLGIDHRKFTVK